MKKSTMLYLLLLVICLRAKIDKFRSLDRQKKFSFYLCKVFEPLSILQFASAIQNFSLLLALPQVEDPESWQA